MSGWGPWSEGLAHAERRARLRVLRAISLVMTGMASPATLAIGRALDDPATLPDAYQALAALPSLVLRRSLSTYRAAELGAIDD